MRRIDWIGTKIGKLTPIDYYRSNGKTIWICKCDCGKKTKVTYTHLGTDTNSCGCIRTERNKKIMLERMKLLDGRDASKTGGYHAIHGWARRRLEKPSVCPKCGKKVKLELSNISGTYQKDVSDYEYICRKCHMKLDGRYSVLSLKQEVSVDYNCGGRTES